MDRHKLCLFWGVVLGVAIGLASCDMLYAGPPLQVTQSPLIVVTQPPVIEVTSQSSGAGESGPAEHTPPPDRNTSPPPFGRRPQLLVFTAPDWCAPCRTLDAELRGLRELSVGGVKAWANEVGPGERQAVRVLDASVEDSTERKLATDRKVTTWPTIIRIDRDGKETSRHVGSLNAATLSRYQAGTWSPVGAVAARPMANNVHTHRCPRCSTQWSHGEEAAGNARAHNCPNCGTAQFEIDHWGGVRYAAPAQTQQPKRTGFFRSLFGG